MMNLFEAAKFHYGGMEEEWDIPLPAECGIDDDEDLGIEGRDLKLTR
jgi:hypothetical protein